MGGRGKKVATPTKKAAGGFKFGGPSKKAATPTKVMSEGPNTIVRGFSSAWNPTTSDDGKLRKGSVRLGIRGNPARERNKAPINIRKGGINASKLKEMRITVY